MFVGLFLNEVAMEEASILGLENDGRQMLYLAVPTFESSMYAPSNISSR